MNRPLRHIAVFCGVLVLALLARATWVQFVQGDELAERPPQPARQDRGVLLPARQHHRRRQADHRLGGDPRRLQVQADVQGRPDVRAGHRLRLPGPGHVLPGGHLQQDAQRQGRPARPQARPGHPDRQEAARRRCRHHHRPQGAEGRVQGADRPHAKGAVVALDPRNGRVLALASTPSYDPSVFTGISNAEGQKFKALDADKTKPLSNRALRETYAARLHLQDPHRGGGPGARRGRRTSTPRRAHPPRTSCRRARRRSVTMSRAPRATRPR